MTVVLDASAALALLQDEPGADRVEELLKRSLISTVNATEIITKLIDNGMSATEALTAFDELSLRAIPFDERLAEVAGILRASTRHAGLSLGDRACIALAQRLNAPAVTTDRSWANLDLDVKIELIR